MLLTPFNQRPFWLQMLVAVFAALGTTFFVGMGFFFLLNVAGRRQPPRSAPVASPAPPPQQAPAQSQAVPQEPAAPITAAPRPTENNLSKLPDSETELYKNQIASLKESSELHMQFSKEALGIQAVSMADGYIKRASHDNDMAQCLGNQLSLGVPYYQGQSTCATAIPSQAPGK